MLSGAADRGWQFRLNQIALVAAPALEFLSFPIKTSKSLTGIHSGITIFYSFQPSVNTFAQAEPGSD